MEERSPSFRRASPVGFPTFQLSKPHQRLRILQRWVAEHDVRRLSLKDAARIAGLEPHHFSATFHLCVGITFGQWTRDYRVALAVRGLKCGVSSIEQVVEFVGYQDRRSLERAIKRATGKTLGQMQRRYSR